MAANRTQLQDALHKPYDRVLFSREVLSPVFGSGFTLFSSPSQAGDLPNKSESAVIDQVGIYGKIKLDDGTEITCYEIWLQPQVRIEQSKVAIQQYVRKLLTAGQAALINFVAPSNKNVWRLTLVAKDSVLTEQGVKEKTTNAKRYTFLLGPSETCKTAAERFEVLSTEREITFQTLLNAFSVEKLSKAFFDEYTLHYQNFCDYLQESNYRRSVFNISFPNNATKQEKDKASKPIRDFVKKLLGRIVFLYFVQKKGWLGASNTDYTDGPGDFIRQLFIVSGGDETFYSSWLTVLFFDTLNRERPNDDFTMPEKTVKVPFLNGGLFDREEFDEQFLTFPAALFHHPDFEDVILTEKNAGYARGFLDFLDAFNFTVYEDSPDDHIVAVDPEMLGHIFENLLEDNKDKGAFYTPKEIVHYMCQESLTEYCLKLDFSDYGITMVDEDKRKLIESIIKKKEVDIELLKKFFQSEESSKSWFRQLEMHLDKLKICDPAIGSGAFPMGLLQEIFSIKELIAYETGKEWKPAEVKLNIIQNSIYGVDIEKGAVDIARLRFWLSLVVDEEKPRPLPNLDYKIVVGDSLISKFDGEIIEIDWDVKEGTQTDMFGNENLQNRKQLLQILTDKQRKYFDPTNNKNKKALALEIRNHKIDILINQLELMVKSEGLESAPVKANYVSNKKFVEACELYQKTQGWVKTIDKLKYLKQHPEKPFNHFDWKLDFPEVLNPYLVPDEKQRGFDIVIGNPPYISFYSNTGSDLSLDEKKHIVKVFDSVQKENDRINSMNLFSEKGIKILKQNGNLAFIVNKTMGVLPSYSFYREYILENVQFKYAITDLTPFEAIVDCLIFSIEKRKPKTEYSFKFYKGDIVEYTWESIDSFKKNRKYEFHIPKNDGILDLIDKAPNVLSDILVVNRGVNIGGCFEVFLSDKKASSNHYKYLSGTKCVKPYYYEWSASDGYMIFDVKKEKELRATGKTLALGNRERYLQPRLFIPESAQTIMAAYTDELIYSAYGLLVGTSEKGKNYLKYACGILNSKLITFYSIQKEILRKGNKATPHVGVKGLNDIPIYIEKQICSEFAIIVDYITFLKSVLLSDSSYQLMPIYFEQIIDGMVYELYFPELLKKHDCEIIKHLGELPEFTEGMSDEDKMEICQKVFDRLNDATHPVRINLDRMKEEIPEIRIIEGLDN
jgi:hypothetical protein